MQLISKFSCRLNIERNGARLLGPKLQSILYTVSMHDSNKMLTISISPKSNSVSLPNSEFIPRIFTHKHIHKVSKQCLEQGRLTITLINYSAKGECVGLAGQGIQTSVYISEAPVDALRHFWMTLQQGPSKRDVVDAQMEREKVRKKPRFNVWTTLNTDVVRIILEYLGENLSHLSLVSRGWSMMISEMSRKVKFNYPKDINGEVITRILKKHPFLKSVVMKDCRNFQAVHLKKAISLPMKHVQVLNLQGCRKVNSQVLFTLILNTPKLKVLNIIDTLVDDVFFLDINPTLHLKALTELRAGNLSELGVANIAKKCKDIEKIEIHPEVVTGKMTEYLLSLSSLQELRIYYQSVQGLFKLNPVSKLQVIEFLQIDAPHTTSQCLDLWVSLKSQDPTHIGCNLPKDSLFFLWENWKNLSSARLTEYLSIPSSIKSLSLYYSEDLDDDICGRTAERNLVNLKFCEILARNLEFYHTQRVVEHFKSTYPNCKLSINTF